MCTTGEIKNNSIEIEMCGTNPGGIEVSIEWSYPLHGQILGIITEKLTIIDNYDMQAYSLVRTRTIRYRLSATIKCSSNNKLSSLECKQKKCTNQINNNGSALSFLVNHIKRNAKHLTFQYA